MNREETLALWRQGRDAWNAWAARMLAESLGFDGSGFGDQILRSTLGSITQTVLTNVLTPGANPFAGLVIDGSKAGIANATQFGVGISTFIGGYIAREIVAPETVAGSIGGTIGDQLLRTVAGSVTNNVLSTVANQISANVAIDPFAGLATAQGLANIAGSVTSGTAERIARRAANDNDHLTDILAA